MNRTSLLLFTHAVLFALVMQAGLSTGQTTQSGPDSLKGTINALYLAPPSKLNTTAGAASTKCMSISAQTPTGDLTFNTPGNPVAAVGGAPMTINGSYYALETATLTLVFRDNTAPGAPQVVGKYKVGAGLKFGSSAERSGGAAKDLTFAPGSSSATLTFDFPITANNTLNTTGGAIGIHVKIDPDGPTSTGDFAIDCGAAKSGILRPLTIFMGTGPSDGDLDVDHVPDSVDSDMDGDGVPNTAEKDIQCDLEAGSIDFSRDGRVQPGDHDYDQDGYTDEEECELGYDPTTKASTPPTPEGFPWGLLILTIIAVGIAALILFFFTTFGKAATVTIASAAEIIVPPGGQGKYQVEASSRRSKGNPITYQLATTGLPEGWDAKLSLDHVVLDPVGGPKPRETLWLTVEAPQHADPESAVVTVKAIPLNAAGRKDTFKLVAKASTITSINVPPNARVPVKRGATVKLKSERELAQEAAAPPVAAEPVTAAAQEEAEKPRKGKKGKKEEVSGVPPPTPAPAPSGSKPALQVGGLQHEPPSFKQGETVKSSVTVSNNGNAPQTLKLTLFVNDGLADAQTVTVKPGKSKEVKFKWTAQERNKLNIRGELVAA